MKWMTKPENVKKISLDAGSLFAIKYEVGAGDEVDPLQAKFVNAASEAAFVVTHFQFQYDAEVVAEFGQALGAMALGQATPEEFVEQLRSVAE
jgi:raffinose/stachyose/melibiose transport system substrate-binding protein